MMSARRPSSTTESTRKRKRRQVERQGEEGEKEKVAFEEETETNNGVYGEARHAECRGTTCGGARRAVV